MFQNQKLPEQHEGQTIHQMTANPQNTVKRENQDGLLDVIKQQGVLTKLLYEAQVKSTLPGRSMPTFDGEPLKYMSWLAAFKHTIEDKTSNYRERLGFLENFTSGQPNSLVRSCLQMDDPEKGYTKAMSLLEKRYGNKFRIQETIIKKVQEWPELKANDVKALEGFSLFLNEAANTMGDPITSELNHATNMKAIALKLPYGMKEKWRSKVNNLEEIHNRAATFADMVNFIDTQVKMMNHPLYGCAGKPQAAVTKPKRSFATKTEETNAGKKHCGFCQVDGHAIDTCRKLAKNSYPDRINFIRKSGLCFGCLKKAAHRVKDCTNKLKCQTCNGKHPSVLHRDKNSQANQHKASGESSAKKSNSNDENSVEKPTTTNGKGNNSQKSQFCGLTGAGNNSVQIVPVLVRSKESGVTVRANAMLDECSDATFISESLKAKLKIRGPKTTLSLQTLTGHKNIESQALVGLEVMDLHGEGKIDLPKSYSCPEIPASTAHVLNNEDLKRWPYLTKVNLPKVEGEVEVLIGNDTPKALEPWEIIHSQSDSPFASKTLLGWLVHGASERNSSSSVFAYRVKVDEVMNNQLKDLYNMDFNERIIQDTPQKSMEDKQFMTAVTNSIKCENGHYTIGLPLKEPEVEFPDNRPQAEQRLASLKRKMQKNEMFKAEYTTFMSNLLTKGYAEEVPEEEARSDGKVWYLPHHGVYHPRKRKLRVVYDCAAVYKTKALNQELLQGPNLTNNLVGVLSRFRKDSVALMADIEAMYHQVKVPLCDKDLLRFLWWPDGNTDASAREYRMSSHVFGATSSPTIANYALQKVADKANGRVGEIVRRNFYVDDCLFSTRTEADAIKLAEELTEVCRDSGFHLTKWVSNHRNVLLTIPETERAKDVKNIDLSQDELPAERALGLLWSAESDSFGFQIVTKYNPPTRRGILSTVSSVFDPLGLIAPVLLPAKRLLQDLTRSEISWDDKIPETYEEKWNQWISSIPDIARFSIPRCFVPLEFGTPVSVRLHHFSDASEIGYGTVSYSRYVNQQQDIHCSLVMGKSKVAPLKQVSIPRLELSAATTAVRVHHMIYQELDINVDDTFFWTDSQTVLKYINNTTARFKTFVANRIGVIRDGSEPSQWRYVETSQNPADFSSRGQPVHKFLQNDMWRHGPNFLWKPECARPVTSLPEKSNQNDPEYKAVTCNAIAVTQTLKEIPMSEVKPDPVANQTPEETLNMLFEAYSDWTKLKRAISWLLRLKHLLLRKSKHDFQEDTSNKEEKKSLTAQELQDGENAIIKCVQQMSFPQEIKSLTDMKNAKGDMTERNSKIMKKSMIANLDPEIHEDGMLRVGGRIRNAPIPVQARHQVIIPACGQPHCKAYPQ